MKAVRCGSSKATPYLRKHIDLFTECMSDDGYVIDLGCGNGRNSEYLLYRELRVLSLDAKNDYGTEWFAGTPIPNSGAADCILCNYLLMFLDERTRNDVYDEMTRVSHKGTRLRSSSGSP